MKEVTPIECLWIAPSADEVLVCCDGAAAGNPGVSGAGVVARNSDCECLCAAIFGLGVMTN